MNTDTTKKISPKNRRSTKKVVDAWWRIASYSHYRSDRVRSVAEKLGISQGYVSRMLSMHRRLTEAKMPITGDWCEDRYTFECIPPITEAKTTSKSPLPEEPKVSVAASFKADSVGAGARSEADEELYASAYGAGTHMDWVWRNFVDGVSFLTSPDMMLTLSKRFNSIKRDGEDPKAYRSWSATGGLPDDEGGARLFRNSKRNYESLGNAYAILALSDGMVSPVGVVIKALGRSDHKLANTLLPDMYRGVGTSRTPAWWAKHHPEFATKFVAKLRAAAASA